MFVILLVASIVLQRWAWRRYRRAAREGAISRRQAGFRFAVVAAAPALAVASLVAAALTVESAAGLTLLSEAGVRAGTMGVAILTVGGCLGWLAFTIDIR